jgi:hypothetical protein
MPIELERPRLPMMALLRGIPVVTSSGHGGSLDRRGTASPRTRSVEMKRLRLAGCVGALLLAAGLAPAQFNPRCAPPQYAPPSCPTPVMPYVPGTTPPTPVIPPPVPGTGTTPEMGGAGLGSSFASAPEGGTQAPPSFNPAMFGDFIGVLQGRVVRQTVTVTNGQTFRSPGTNISGNIASVVAPVPYRAAFKIAENESPRPVDRIYLNYNYYDNATRLIDGVDHMGLHRETLGFEKTFLDGEASIGLRVPLLQLTGDSDVQDYQFGDMDLLFKFALLDNRRTGNIFSTGLVLTLPTSKDVEIDGESNLHAFIAQPWVGGIVNFENCYLQGFSSVAIPFDSRDVTIWFNSIGAGVWLARDNDPNARIKGIVPTVELHLNTPLNHRGLDHADPIYYLDSLDCTVGVHVLFSRVTAGVAVGTPLTGPRPYDVEAIGSLDFHW